MLKKLLIPLFFTFILSAELSAQKVESSSYKTAIGVKFYPGAISLKHFISKDRCIETLAYSWRGNRLSGLYEKYFAIPDFESLKWYAGAGAHVSLYDKNYYNGASFIGADAVLGLDYKPEGLPLNLSLDWQPSLDLGGGNGFSANWAGIGVRFVIE